MTTVIAHRGASAYELENTVRAFELARTLGAEWVELDVRRTADDRLAVYHDAELADGRTVVSCFFAELPDHVPDLVRAIAACDGMGVNIEIKNSSVDPDYDEGLRVADLVVATIHDLGVTDTVLVSSFDLATIDRVRSLDPAIPTGWLVARITDRDRTISRVAERGHVAINPRDEIVDRALLDAAAGAGLAVNVWTVDTPYRIAELGDLGVEGIITNVPDVALRVLTGRRPSD